MKKTLVKQYAAWMVLALAASGCHASGSSDAQNALAGAGGGEATPGTSGAAGSAAGSGNAGNAGNADGVSGAAGEGSMQCERDPLACRLTPLDRGIATNLLDATRFLCSGDDPLQTGLEENALDPARISVLRGRVLDAEGEPLEGVRLRTLRHAEFGETRSRPDGYFDLVVNGGESLVLVYEKEGLLSSQRTLTVHRQRYEWLPDVVLIPEEGESTTVAAQAPNVQSVRGSRVSDSFGERQATLLVPPETVAVAELKDGSTAPLETMTIRLTEYTVGDSGPERMPGTLPATSAYTYAFEASVAEANDLGASSVQFDAPVPFYLENFLGFPAGTVVPNGYYDRERGEWVASDSGLVIEVVSVDSGQAELDIDGDGSAEPMEELEEVGISDLELESLAQLYEPGQSLWRVPLPHLSTWDCNWPFEPPEDAAFPDPGPAETPNQDAPCAMSGSIIYPETQTLGEALPISGTGHTLRYFSDRTLGRRASNVVEIPLTSAEVPASLKAVELEIQVAGQRFEQRFDAEPGQQYVFEWDGRDGYGRVTQGETEAVVRVGYVYDGVYASTTRFGLTGSGAITGSISRKEVVLWSERIVELGLWDAEGLGLGGWSIDVHHTYNPVSQRLLLGSGSRRSADAVGRVARDITDPEFVMSLPDSLTLGPDGTVYVSDDGLNQVFSIGRDGAVTVLAGTGAADNTGDGGLATEAALFEPQGLYLRSDGVLLVAVRGRIRAIDLATGLISTFAGGGDPSTPEFGDGFPATQAVFDTIDQIVVGPDGSLYLPDLYLNRVRRIGPDGIITTFAGGGSNPGSGPATEALLQGPSGIAIASDGSVYISERIGNRIVRVTPDGNLSIVVDVAMGLDNPRIIAFADDGSLLISDELNNRIVRWDGSELTTVVGGGSETVSDGIAARNASIPTPDGLAVAGDGTVYIASDRVLSISPSLPGLGATDIVLPSLDGNEFYVFDGSGRHLATRDALTGATLREFGYDDRGQLASITEPGSQVTTIERDVEGVPTALVAPSGQRTALGINSEGLLESITDPLGRLTELGYGGTGLLEQLVDPNGGSHRFEYDSVGRLIRDTGPTGFAQTLSRSAEAGTSAVSVTTPLGRTRTLSTAMGDDGATQRRNEAPDGTASDRQSSETTHTLRRADGSVLEVSLGPDVRWQMQVPIPRSTVLTLPSGRTLTTTRTQVLRASDPNSPLTMTSLVDTTTTPAGSVSRTYDAEARTLTLEIGGEVVETRTYDDAGRVAEIVASGYPTVSRAYDAAGRLIEQRLASGTEERVVSYAYDDDGYLSTITGPDDAITGLIHDAAGRVITELRPDGEATELGYTPLDGLASVTPPDRDAHTQEYDRAGLLTRYAPPPLDGTATPTTYAYDADLALTQVATPDSRTVEYEYDSAGRQSRINVAAGSYAITYDEATGQRTAWTTPQSNDVAWSYDGPLVTSSTWSGEVTGSVAFDYDAALRLASIGVTGGSTVNLYYNAASNLSSAGPLTLTRPGLAQPLSALSVGAVTTTFTYTGFAELSTESTAVGGGASLFSRSYDRDVNGRIVTVTELLEGSETTTDYQYDAAGRLVHATVTTDGAPTTDRSYSYDPNGNRIGFEATGLDAEGIELTGEYDAQDRILRYGTKSYAHDPNGNLVSVTDSASGSTTLYDYDELGQLQDVTLPDGRVISYAYDLIGRRIARRVDGLLQEGYLWLDELRPLAKLGPDGQVVQQYVYGEGVNVPDLMLSSGRTYRLVRDQVGSVRLVVDMDSGEVVQRLDYDEFGRVLQDSNPRLQPFGFAGGLYDPETGLVRFGARDYDPATGRWTAKDPIRWDGGQANLYVYVENDPTNWTDSGGLLTITVGPSLSVCLLGVCSSGALSFVTDLQAMDLNLSFSFGAATQPFSAGVSANIEFTNACRIDDLNGTEYYGGISGGELLTGTINGVWASGYEGVSFGLGLGPAASPAEIHGGMTVGANIFTRLW